MCNQGLIIEYNSLHALENLFELVIDIPGLLCIRQYFKQLIIWQKLQPTEVRPLDGQVVL